MDATTQQPKTEIVNFLVESQKELDEFKVFFHDMKPHMSKFEQNVNHIGNLSDTISSIQAQIEQLEKNHKYHQSNLAKSLQTLERNASTVFDSVLEEKKKDTEQLKKLYAECTVDLETIQTKLLSLQKKIENTPVNEIYNQLQVLSQKIETCTAAYEQTKNKLVQFDSKYSVIIDGQNAHNLSMKEKISELIQKLQVLENEKPKVEMTSLETQMDTLQKEITFLKRIIGAGLALFAGWYLWLQVQSGEINKYLS